MKHILNWKTTFANLALTPRQALLPMDAANDGDCNFVHHKPGLWCVCLQMTGSNALGDDTLRLVMNSLLDALQGTFKQTAGLALIGSHLPALRFDQGNLRMSWTDVHTGQGHTSTFDMNGGFIADGEHAEVADNAHFHVSMVQQFVRIASEQGAVGATWEAQTAYQQQNAGVAQAGQSTEQRARAQGQWLGIDLGNATPGNAAGITAANADVHHQTVRPIALDLDGGGITVTTRAQGGSVMVDIDDDGFAEEVDWVGPREGTLVLDRNGDGLLTQGRQTKTMAADGFANCYQVDSCLRN